MIGHSQNSKRPKPEKGVFISPERVLLALKAIPAGARSNALMLLFTYLIDGELSRDTEQLSFDSGVPTEELRTVLPYLTTVETLGKEILSDSYRQRLMADELKGDWRKLRKEILHRDLGICAYCGKAATSVDHITPRALGGKSEESNLVSACKRCNSRKGGRTASAAKMAIIYRNGKIVL